MDGAGDLPLSRSRLHPRSSTGAVAPGGQTNLLEQPAMGRSQTEQAVEARVLVKLAPDLQKLDVQPVRLGIGNAGRIVLAANHTKQTDQSCRAASRKGQNSTLRQIRSPPA